MYKFKYFFMAVMLTILLGAVYAKYALEIGERPLSQKALYQQQLKRVTDIGVKIIKASGDYFPTLRVRLLESDVDNAWYSPSDDTITITTTIIKGLDDNQIAMLFAHELSHKILGHGTEWQNPDEPGIRAEMMADSLGTFLMLRAGYDVCDGVKVFAKFRDEYEGYPTTHPDNSFRIYHSSMPWCPKI